MRHLPDTLIMTLSRHLDLSKSRLETFATLIIGCICARTVNLSHIASHFQTGACIASSYRRLQRFFQHVQLDEDWLARMLLALSGTQKPYTLCLDRTNWKVGRTHINLLVLCIVARRVRIPLMWCVLNKAGTSNYAERTSLMDRALACLGSDTIRVVLADREFLGHQWLSYLIENNVPFAIRAKEGYKVRLRDGRILSLASLFKKCRQKTSLAYEGSFVDMPETRGMWFAAKRIKKTSELLILATTYPPKQAISLYRKRWQIECLFGDTKTRGLNLEDTRLTDPKKLSVLICVIALAVLWSHLSAAMEKGRSNIKRASHGYLRKSWFRTGFDYLRQWILYNPDKAAQVWTHKWKRKIATMKRDGVV